MNHVAVIDIGKTNAKMALVDLETLDELVVATRPSKVLPGPPWPHIDIEGHWSFLLDALQTFHRDHGVDVISVTTHGASAVMLDASGALAAPMLDYEHPGPDAAAAAYDAIRPPFAETGSPRLGMGLNLGAQFHWMFQTDPTLKSRIATIVTYPQYWGFRLTGVAATEVTSLGCHTDLWNPHSGEFSSLVTRLGIAEKMAPTRPSADVLGPILPEIADRTGLARETPVHVGIHDSNASLLPHVIARDAPFSVVSSGTWVIAMAVGGAQVELDPAQDTLINVNALGHPVPSARFMGGREFELATAAHPAEPTDAEIRLVLDQGLMLLPAIVQGSGPFQGRVARWLPEEPLIGSGSRAAAVAFYLALVTNHCLGLIGHRGPVIVEGPFVRNRAYMAMLSVATGVKVIPAGSATGTSQGAALLAATGVGRRVAARSPAFQWDFSEMQAYASTWQRAVD